jgi:hypothetical protein
MEFPAVGARPTVVDLAQVVGEALLFTKDHPVGTNGAEANPSFNGNAVAVEATTVIYPVFVSVSDPFALVATSVTAYVPAVL